jgi:hypothetical protein
MGKQEQQNHDAAAHNGAARVRDSCASSASAVGTLLVVVHLPASPITSLPFGVISSSAGAVTEQTRLCPLNAWSTWL